MRVPPVKMANIVITILDLSRVWTAIKLVRNARVLVQRYVPLVMLVFS
jgi:hypothetical protein